MSSSNMNFKQRVEFVVSTIPRGKVMTYGQVAAVCGNARAARIVGGIAHYGDINLPWQRVVNYKGGLASGYPGGRSGHKQVLEVEGVSITEDFYIDLQKYLYIPDNS